MEISNSGFQLNRLEVAEFSLWLANNPTAKYKRSADVVKAFVEFKTKVGNKFYEYILTDAQ